MGGILRIIDKELEIKCDPKKKMKFLEDILRINIFCNLLYGIVDIINKSQNKIYII